MRDIYIGFEGPIGAGKTTLSQLLAAHCTAALILEDVDGNEFLADFYQDRTRWALAMQLWFLTARHRQLSAELSMPGPIVADYTFAKDRIFAGLLLDARDLQLYDRISAGMRALRRPDLVVYLDADDMVLLQRIARRARTYEAKIDRAYLDEVRKAYESYFSKTAEIKLLRIDTTSLDLGSRDQLNELYGSIFRHRNTFGIPRATQ